MKSSSDANKNLRRQKANAIRALSMDAVQKANSGHPGMPMGMADIAEVLWSDFLRFNPRNPDWFDRDRFIISNGHGSMLHYALLHLTGFDLPIEEIMNFRQLHSKTPGHPEFGDTPGVETTTGPLGQGISNGVGFALAEKLLASYFNRDELDIVNHFTWVLLGDGCLMEGISHEACSLAGTLKLGKLIAVWDDNGISIDGNVKGWFTDDTAMRFRSYGWQVIEGVDGHEPESIKNAIADAVSDEVRPTLICCRTVIGWGSPNKGGKETSHGSPLGEDEIKLVRDAMQWICPPFEIPPELYHAWDATESGAALESDWNKKFREYTKLYPERASEFKRRIAGELPIGWNEMVNEFVRELELKQATLASRKSSQLVLNKFAQHLPELIGGSADLTGSNLTSWSGSEPVTADSSTGNYIYYGVREFAMAAITNGLSLHGGLVPFCATFLTFSDYARNALRMSALMRIRTVFVFTHDSIGLGEDGPTHQPIEHIESLRLIPNMSVWRPCDLVETVVGWRSAIERVDGPTSLILSRQNLAHQSRSQSQIENIEKGGYVLRDCDGLPNAIIIATGSEIELAVKGAIKLEEKGHFIRVVSMPSTNIFDDQDEWYRESVLPNSVTVRIAIEAGTSRGWSRYVGHRGCILGLDSFGASAPSGAVFDHFGFTISNVVSIVESCILN
ncbi:MAG: transketolase [Acidiferrobacteraceae bacterium]|jgi:transketolase|nr:transketolase [Acidiferrobacteraceae bacterium]|tara:strand:- start:31104 stop:33128 length:2025 start_codon:yes stop_codon:yes gene_type:complete